MSVYDPFSNDSAASGSHMLSMSSQDVIASSPPPVIEGESMSAPVGMFAGMFSAALAWVMGVIRWPI